MRVRCGLQKLMCALPMLLVAAAMAQGAAMERGLAITDPDLLRSLDDSGLSLGRMLGADANSFAVDLFALPSMAPLRDATDRDFNSYVVRHRDDPGRMHLFDRAALNAPGTRFDLVGIVNRMDRSYVSPDQCGEVRLIYRPVAQSGSATSEAAPSRLPMTLNLVMKAKPAGADTTCAALALRWFAMTSQPTRSTLTASGGALEWVTSEAIDRIEINVQIARASTDNERFEGRADYLMRVFRYDGKRFEESALENQIDVERIRADAKLAADLKQWLLDPVRIADLDRGTIVLPDRFLATSAIAMTPASSRPDDGAGKLFADGEVAAALEMALAKAPLEHVLSSEGFARRLLDMTCSGCHQTRSIGGFHFPGAERRERAATAVMAAGSPHFVGDQERRIDILTALQDGVPPDFSRGFSARPQMRRSKVLSGTTYVNGWGATCYVPPAGAAPDRSFASWTCAQGLTCQSTGASNSRGGFCFPESK